MGNIGEWRGVGRGRRREAGNATRGGGTVHVMVVMVDVVVEDGLGGGERGEGSGTIGRGEGG